MAKAARTTSLGREGEKQTAKGQGSPSQEQGEEWEQGEESLVA